MARQNLAFLAFNRGLVSRLALARLDVKRLALSAETMVNWMCRVMGSMMLRPGLGYLGTTYQNAAAKYLPFVFSTSDTALVELTNLILRIWISDALVTRPSVATAVTDGTFVTNGSTNAAWTDADEAGATSAWVSAGKVGFTGTGTAAAIRTQTVAVANIGVEHALRIVVERGPITLRVGSAASGDQYINETQLGTGTHSLAFTPGAAFYIQFISRLARIVYLNQCTVEAAGVLTLPTPWVATDLGKVRQDQSGDILFVACATTYQQRKIERRATRSWSVVLYQPEDGPFRIQNTGVTTITPSVLTGNGTLTASLPLFRSTHVGALFQLISTGQTVTKVMAILNDVSSSIRVTGVGTDRTITAVIAGITAGRVITLERSFDNATWVAQGTTYAVDGATGGSDGLDNQIVYYRLKLTTVGAAGNTTVTLSIPTGSITGVARVTAFTSNILVDAEILVDMGATNATDDWAEGKWSGFRGWPSSVGIYEGRLWWAGKDAMIGSESDAFLDFDPNALGDAAPINRTIGSGPVDNINWILPLQRLLLGAEGSEFSCRSTSFDEPLTPSNFNIKAASTQGSAAVPAVRIDKRGVYVQRGGSRVFELAMGQDYDYQSTDLTLLIPEIGQPKIVRMAVQRQPDTRIHCVRSDGIVVVAVLDRAENVLAWLKVASDGAGGLIEDVVVLPSVEGDEEDQVYYVVKRTINGADVRYLEKWAFESECRGATACKLADAFVIFTGPAYVVTGLAHLEGEEVVVWADGLDIGTNADDELIYTVTGGQITLPQRYTTVAVGLPYTAQWKSAKLGMTAPHGTSLTAQKLISELGVICADIHPKGLQYGPDFDTLRDMPMVEGGRVVDPDTVRVAYDEQMFTFPGKWSTDTRLCLQAKAPRPVTVLAAVIAAEVHD